MLNLQRILAGLVLSILIGGLAYQRGSLTQGGWIGAVITGTLTFGLGGLAWGLTVVAFFVTSTLFSHFRQVYKQRVAGEKFEKGNRRDLGQVLANGGAAALLALLYGLGNQPSQLLALFAGIMATVTADTWATELGVLSRQPPRSITTFQIVAPGTSGGITLAGLLASVAGACMIGSVLLVMVRFEHRTWLGWLPLAALVGGIAGSLADSVLGATIQAIYLTAQGMETERPQSANGVPHRLVRGWPWMNNDAVNLLSSLFGGVCALAVLLLVGG